MRQTNCIWILAAIIVVGCNKSTSGSTSGTPPAPIETPMGSGNPASTTALPVPPSKPVDVPPGTPNQAATEQVTAAAGVGIKGKSLEGESGVLVEPAKAFFRFEQSAVFNIQIPQAMQLFEASEGRKPKNQDEFMTKIVAANSIKLPELPAGHKYVYDVTAGELKVERPAK